MKEEEFIKTLLKLWSDFTDEMILTKNYVDSDFTFDNFMRWLKIK